MARSPDDIKGDRYVRMLLLGEPKAGKSVCAVATSPKPVRIILCESDAALVPVKRVTRDFTFDVAVDHDSMTSAILSAKRAAKAGEIKTIVLDPLSTYGVNLLDIATETITNKFAVYPTVERQVCQIIDQLLEAHAHVVVVSHFIVKEGDDANLRKTMIPLLPGQKLQKLVPSKFNDVVWFHYDPKTGRRTLKVNPVGVFGPSGRSFREAKELEGDVHSDAKYVGIAAFIRQMKKERKRIAAEDLEGMIDRERESIEADRKDREK